MKVLLISANRLNTPYPVYPIGLDYVRGALPAHHEVRLVDLAVEPSEELAADGIGADVIDLLSLRPWDKGAVVESVCRTHRAVVVEEAPPVCGIAAEVAANVYELAFDELDAPIERVSGADVPLPYARELEQACIPHAVDVVAAARRALK